jgi:hypothetical protein
MSASVYYQQIKPQEKEQIWTPAPSSFIRTLTDAFGEAPWELSEDSITLLSGMALVYSSDGDNPYRELIRAIRKLGTVKVWFEY